MSSDSERPDPSASGAATDAVQGTFYRWQPDPQARGTFRNEEAAEGPLPAALVELYVTTNEDGSEIHELRGTFDLAPDDYFRAEALGWLGLRKNVARVLGAAFTQESPIRIVAQLQSSYFPPPGAVVIDPADPLAGLGELIGSFLDENVPGMSEFPLAWQTGSAQQQQMDGVVELSGWTEEQARSWPEHGFDEPPGEIEPVADEDWPFDTPPVPSVADEDKDAYWTEPHCEVTFLCPSGDPPDVTGVLRKMKVVEKDDIGVTRAELTVAFDLAVYRQIEKVALFGLTAESKGGSLLGEFSADEPVEMTLVMSGELLAETFGGVDLLTGIPEKVEQLADTETARPIRKAASYTYRDVLQQPPGQVFSLGFGNRNEP